MNEINQFWQEFCRKNNLTNVSYKEAFQFGTSPGWLASLVVEGKKTATTSGYVFYELENEELPKKGDYSIVLDENNQPVAVIQIQSVDVLPMNEVSEEFALAEGEGDYNFWWHAHEEFFTNELKLYGKTFSPDLIVVCERFVNLSLKSY
ncbi:ASCH domain-containing protein [Priestia flexa]|uniref:ASCH domain-containing protein n=1 Tax=Priestia flexa TaxID=86664 RepID=UPI001B32DD67|nr:ASCH domain-containing protein [Priestia flexa]